MVYVMVQDDLRTLQSHSMATNTLTASSSRLTWITLFVGTINGIMEGVWRVRYDSVLRARWVQ